MAWMKYAFWFLICILVLSWIAWWAGRDKASAPQPTETQKTEVQKKETSSLFGRDWFSGGLFFAPLATGTEPSNGATSQFKDMVALYDAGGAQESDPNKEYITIKASPWNKDTVVVSGWSIKTPSGKTITIGDATDTFRRGQINQQGPVALSPGDRLAIVTGRSPLGLSFRENICSGYLEQFQDFYPPISLSCPDPSVDIANRNLSVELECVQFVSSISRCETRHTGIPSNLSSQCRDFVARDLTYNGCVAVHQNDLFFFKDLWRYYAGENREIWSNGGDTIRLYDARGSLVSTFTY